MCYDYFFEKNRYRRGINGKGNRIHTGNLRYVSYRSSEPDLANSKTIYGDWHYYIETDKELFNSVESGEKGKGYTLEQCGKMEIRDVVAEEFMICFIHADETYRQMAHRDLLEGTFPEKENEIAADGFVLSNLGFSGNLGDSLRIGEKEYIVTVDKVLTDEFKKQMSKRMGGKFQ